MIVTSPLVNALAAYLSQRCRSFTRTNSQPYGEAVVGHGVVQIQNTAMDLSDYGSYPDAHTRVTCLTITAADSDVEFDPTIVRALVKDQNSCFWPTQNYISAIAGSGLPVKYHTLIGSIVNVCRENSPDVPLEYGYYNSVFHKYVMIFVQSEQYTVSIYIGT